MTAETSPRIKITYATLRADNEELHAGFEAAAERVRAGLGAYHRNYVNGAWRDGDGTFEVLTPIDTSVVLGTFARGTAADVDAAVAAARAAQPAWAKTPWTERVAILRRAAELISDRLMDESAVMAFEVGKNRIEALGEVEESADLIRYYAQTAEDNAFYDHPMGNLGDAAVHTRSILRPHGVFAVVSPFNFPMALSTGPSSAAMLAGNTVVFKPSSASPLSAVGLMQAYIDAGVPAGVVNMVMGPGETVGQALQDHPGIDGIVFTGSYEVGMRLFHSFSRTWPRPCIVEMGGKNPAIVSRHADLDEAAEGIMRSAFGFGGQKCSANSRVYVERPVHDELVRLLVEKSEALTIGDPIVRANWLGPIIDERAVGRHQAAVAEARRDGTVFIGGERLSDGDLARGFYVEPTVVGGLPADHRLFRDELFAPLTAVAAVDSLDEAISLANDSVYGLTAGVYSEDEAEIERFFDRIEAGVLYVNRRAGATTGAWPGIQAFGGWKGSGSTGKAGLSMYYVAQFLREQSHTVVD
jgi:1-pyrroline-5-carboxylate dehydrogenase